jgi:homoserine O-acetyltransferase
VISFSSDWLFPPEQSREIVQALVTNDAQVTYCNVTSPCGHDAFLLANELPVYGGLTRAFLDKLAASPKERVQLADGPHGPTSIFHHHRLDYDRILELIPKDASVLDLGCGPGGLMARLKARNPAARVVGLDLDEQNVLACAQRGLQVIQADLNEGLGLFAAGEFECVVLSRTLQAVRDVEKVLAEMMRVGRSCIVSIPNFGYHRLRRMLAESGRAPKAPGVLHYEWYNTPNIRFFTIADFEDFCTNQHIRVQKQIALDTEADADVTVDPNLNADLAIFVISR